MPRPDARRVRPPAPAQRWPRHALLWAVTTAAACGAGDGPEGAGPEGDTAASASPPPPASTLDGPTGPALLSGLYVRLAAAPAFTPCGSAVVVTEFGGPAADSLDRAYLLERATPGEAVLATVMGRLAPDEPGGRVRLWVDSVVSVAGGDPCPGDDAAPPLEGTAWQLVGLPAAEPALGEAGAWLRLEDDGTLSGFTGCRELVGRYAWTGTRLRFTSLDTQTAMCDLAGVHERFLGALAGTGSYRYRDGGLDLLDENGTVARLEEA